MHPLSDVCIRDIDLVIADIKVIQGLSAPVDSYLAQYLTVYISGKFEELIENIIVGFVKNNTVVPEVSNLVDHFLDISFRNPDSGKILAITKLLMSNSSSAILLAMRDQREGLDSIIGNKNAIAHGKGSVITLGDVGDFYARAQIFIKRIEELLV